jgi:hypothetical protein
MQACKFYWILTGFQLEFISLLPRSFLLLLSAPSFYFFSLVVLLVFL